MVSRAVNSLKNKGVVAMPSDTIYGLFSRFQFAQINRIHQIKKRDKSKPFLIVIPELYPLNKLVDEEFLSAELKNKLAEFWPGRYTLLLKKKADLEYPPGDKIAIRIPERNDNVFFYDVLKGLNEPLVAPSLNIHGEEPLSNLHEILSVFGESIDAVFFNEAFKPQGPSHIVDLTVNPYRQSR